MKEFLIKDGSKAKDWILKHATDSKLLDDGSLPAGGL